MVFIYQRLFKPSMWDVEIIPKIFRNIYYNINNIANPSVRKNLLTKPNMLTKYPGPIMKNLLNDTELVSPDFLNIQSFVKYEESHGNYFKDCDGNTFLDLYTNSGSLPLGYNHNEFLSIANDSEYINSYNNKVDIKKYLPNDFTKFSSLIKSVTPKKMKKLVLTQASDSSTIDTALKISMLRRGNNQVSSILSFSDSHHGTFGGALSSSNFNSNYKVGFPHFKWPVSTFPKIKFPLSENESYNKSEESKSLEKTLKILKENPLISAMIVEAAQSKGGDNWGTPSYFRELRKLALDFKVDFICDEINTGMSTGRNWLHELWDLETPPDMVIFGKKYQISGIFLKKDLIDDNKIIEFNEGMFDYHKFLNFSKIYEIIEKQKLYINSEISGKYFKEKMKELKNYNKYFFNVRGKGNFLAFDMVDSNVRDRFVMFARRNGVFISGSGSVSIQIRSSLIITNNDYDHLLNIIEAYKP